MQCAFCLTEAVAGTHSAFYGKDMENSMGDLIHVCLARPRLRVRALALGSNQAFCLNQVQKHRCATIILTNQDVS